MMWLYKILIVEDEPLISTLIRSILEEGVTTAQVVGEAVNGRIALQMIADLAPDIVLTDINLPILSGLQVIQQAREPGLPENLWSSAAITNFPMSSRPCASAWTTIS